MVSIVRVMDQLKKSYEYNERFRHNVVAIVCAHCRKSPLKERHLRGTGELESHILQLKLSSKPIMSTNSWHSCWAKIKWLYTDSVEAVIGIGRGARKRDSTCGRTTIRLFPRALGLGSTLASTLISLKKGFHTKDHLSSSVHRCWMSCWVCFLFKVPASIVSY